MSDSADRHRRAAEKQGPVDCAIVTVSDTRTPETDVSGRYLKDAVESAGFRLLSSHIVADEPAQLLAVLEQLLAGPPALVLINGGTGISRRDRTFDTLSGRLERSLPGFGELFRTLSFQEIGAAAMLSRATAGTIGDCLIFSMPGSPAAVRLAWEQLIQPEARHLMWELSK